MNPSPVIEVCGLAKEFTIHAQGGLRIPVFSGLSLAVSAGECVALHGPSGCGKSTLLRALYANYQADSGRILIQHRGGLVDMVAAEPRVVLAVRRHTLGYVSQFLRVIPRIAALDVVAEPAVRNGIARDQARERAAALLARLRIPQRLWHLPPATFSGGEQQRVNIARGFILDYPALLLDEPTAALDVDNRDTVAQLIEEAKARGTALVGIFHDQALRERVSDRVFDLESARTIV
ncbi:MAG: phosphonate C-P lyase system protein PhnL [Azospirillaceae bacterium]|nr:phosphonate C-P lyase system protein PhnL [Azospirillaceae bacterium]